MTMPESELHDFEYSAEVADSHVSTSVWLVLQCALILTVVKGMCACIGAVRTLKSINHMTRSLATHNDYPAGRVRDIAGAIILAAAFYPGRALCLEQSLALYARLRVVGIPAHFRFGVQPQPFAAHAWVELGGEPIDERPEVLRKYIPFPESTP